MVQLVDFRKFRVSVNIMLNTFYVTELMVHLSRNASMSRLEERFRSDLLDFQREINKKYAGILFSYLVAAVAGELRHLQINLKDIKWWNKILPFKKDEKKSTINYLENSGIKFGKLSRGEVHDAVIKNLLNSSPERFLAEAVNGFEKFKWRGSMGGNKWAKIAEAALEYARGKLLDVRFIDLVFTLRHNGGRLFDKHASFWCKPESVLGTDEVELNLQLEIQSKAKDIVELITKLSEVRNGFEWYLIQLMRRGEALKYWPSIADLCKEDAALQNQDEKKA